MTDEPKKWIAEGVPTFVVVGKINMGKSSVLATLLEIDDDSRVRISSLPVTTTRCQILPLQLEGEERLRFIDSPGFARSVEAMREIRSIAGERPPGLADVRQFVEEQRGGSEYEDECRLLEPILEGAGVLYVIDSSKPVREASIAEMEILRWTGRPRMALLNTRADAEGDYQQDWKDRLGSYFNLTRTFDAHKAPFSERMRLLKSLVEIDESHRGSIEETIELLEMEWDQRREESARIIIDFLEKAVLLRESEGAEPSDLENERRRAKMAEALEKKYRESLARLERKCVEKLLKVYHHHLLKAETDLSTYDQVDLMSQETWSKLGLDRRQLTTVGAGLGAAGGLAVDIGTGGLTHGAGTIFGALGGAAMAFFKGDELPELKISIDKGAHLTMSEGRKLTVGPPASANFAFILLDSVLEHYAEIMRRTHAQRDDLEIQKSDDSPGYAHTFSNARTKTLAKWFDSGMRGKIDHTLEPDVFAEVVAILQEV